MLRFNFSSFVSIAIILMFMVYSPVYGCNPRRPRRRTIDDILFTVRDALPSQSFEVYNFKVGWYNALVAPKFDLPYSNDTVALSTFVIPGVFDNSFVPFLCKKGLSIVNNSWPLFSEYYMKKVQKKLAAKLDMIVPDKDILYPHIMLGPAHPLILVQTAAHVAGAAYYYQRKEIVNDPWSKNKTIYGVSLHPRYGGWFYMGPVIILRDLQLRGVEEKPVKDVLGDESKKIELLNLYNGNWQNQKWRDVIPVEKKYTRDHLAYRMTYGAKRAKWLTDYYTKHCLSS